MGKETIMFGDIETKKCEFHFRKNLILLEDIDTEKIQVFSVLSSGKRIINILLVIKMMIIKLGYYT